MFLGCSLLRMEETTELHGLRCNPSDMKVFDLLALALALEFPGLGCNSLDMETITDLRDLARVHILDLLLLGQDHSLHHSAECYSLCPFGCNFHVSLG